VAGTPLSTTITELNRLYGEYHEESNKLQPNGILVAKAWFAYVEYCKVFNAERNLKAPGVRTLVEDLTGRRGGENA
jgi:hypothetical protein